MSTVKIIALSSGEKLIAEVQSTITDGSMYVKGVMTLASISDGLSYKTYIVPWIPTLAPDEMVKLNGNTIISSFNIPENKLSLYRNSIEKTSNVEESGLLVEEGSNDALSEEEAMEFLKAYPTTGTKQ